MNKNSKTISSLIATLAICLSSHSLSEGVAGQWTKCRAVDSEGTRYNIWYGQKNYELCFKTTKLCGKNLVPTHTAKPRIIQAPYRICKARIASSSPPRPKLSLTKHLEWVLNHKNRRSRIQHHLNLKQLAEIRAIYKSEQEHSDDALDALARTSNEGLLDALAQNGVTYQENYVSPEAKDISKHIQWTFKHKGTRASTQVALNAGDFKTIRWLFQKSQGQSPMVGRAIAELTNDELEEVLATLGLLKGGPVVSQHVLDFPLHLKWTFDHKNTRGPTQQALNRNDFKSIRWFYQKSQSHNKAAGAAIDHYTDLQLEGILADLGIVRQN